jgi:hypothetical protein
VTCGYSKTVRQCLKDGLTSALKDLRAGDPEAPEVDRPTVILLTPAVADDFGAQRMLHELREDPEHRNRVAVAAPLAAAGALTHCKRVLVVLGFEACYKSKTARPEIRVLHNVSVAEQLGQLVHVLSGQNIPADLVFVGGGYKIYDKSPLEEEKFLLFHLNAIAMSPTPDGPRMASIRVISDKGPPVVVPPQG